MNKLQEYVNKAAEVAELTYAKYCPDEQSQAIAHDCFKEGAEYVIDLELPVKFAEWLHKHWMPFDENDSWQAITPKGHAIETTSTLYAFWIENIYGK